MVSKSMAFGPPTGGVNAKVPLPPVQPGHMLFLPPDAEVAAVAEVG